MAMGEEKKFMCFFSFFFWTIKESYNLKRMNKRRG